MWNIFAKRGGRSDWESVYSTTDAWEAELIRSALISENVNAIVRSNEFVVDHLGKKRRKHSVYVSPLSKRQAELVIQRASIVISKKEDIMAEQEYVASHVQKARYEEEPADIDMSQPEEPVLLAEKEGVGKVLYYEVKDVYELRLEFSFYKESHFMNAEEWDEFTNFSAQRQEFFILLKEKYPRLATLLKENKKRADFLKLIEYSYGKSQPPK